ncbi:transposase [candidate division KSB1 bacterium]|nr:transposase [candidate division KSB1 bacterium]
MFRNLSLQTEIFPCQGKYGVKEIAFFDKTWARVMKDNLLPFLVTIENEYAQFFDARMGRPIKYIALLIVLHILKEIYDWTDEQLVEATYCDKRLEYAFELPLEEVIVCQKTLHNFRQLILTHALARRLFERATAHLIKVLNTDTSAQRLDSSHITSNMAKLSRLELFVRVTENFLRKLKQVAPERYQRLPRHFAERYDQRRGYFADARSRKTQHRLGECANDMWYLIDRFRGDDKIASLKVMTLLQRVFDEHCAIVQTSETTTVTVHPPETVSATADETTVATASALSAATLETPTSPTTAVGDHQKVKPPSPAVVKPANEIPSGALQNPSDEDAAYGYKGQGYEVTLTETCSADNALQLITDVQVDPSNHSDQHTTVAVVDRLAANDLKPEVLYGDGNFVSGENIIACAERGVDLQGNLTGCDSHPEKLKLVDFVFVEDGTTILACPAGQKPLDQRPQRVRQAPLEQSERRFLVHFDRSQCEGCPLLANCPVTLQKKQAVLAFSQPEVVSSQRRREQETEAFKERNNIRAGIESTNAEMKTRHGMGRLRVRGQPRVELVIFFKALGCNIKRMVKYVLSSPKPAPEAPNTVFEASNLAFC